jgi:hypothetical protein
VKHVALALALIAVACLLWLAGEAHRANCIREQRVGCSVLPWIQGEVPPSTENPFDRLDKNPLDALDEQLP